MTKHLVFCVLVGIFLVSCAHTGHRPEQLLKKGSDEVSDMFVVEKKKFEKFDLVKGPWIHDSPGLLIGHRYFLRGFVDKKTNKVTSHQIYAEAGYQSGGWKYYEKCVDENVKDLGCVKIDRVVENCVYGTCVYKETMGVPLSRKKLEKFVESKRDFIFAMKTNGGVVSEFKIDYRYIAAYLKTLKKDLDKIAISKDGKAKRETASEKRKKSGPGY